MMIVTSRLKIKKGKEIMVVIVVGAAIFIMGHWKTLETEEAVELRLNITGYRRVDIPVNGV
jgi:hypothetical protein